MDDALAIMLALGSPELDVIGICTVSGNVPLSTGTRNAQGLLQLLDRTEIPVYAGADSPLKRDPVFATEVHGESGMGQAVLPEPALDVRGNAVDFLVQTLSDQPGEITLIAVGPLTNLALAEQRQPGTLQKAKQVIVMGGAIAETGNSTPVAEFNFYADPHAAQIVVHSGAALLIVPLDATRQVMFSESDIENQIAPLKTVASQFVVNAVQNIIALYRQLGREPIVYLHDPLAVGAAIAPELLRLRNPIHRHRNIGRPHHGPGRHRPPRPAPALASRRTRQLRDARQCRSIFVPIPDAGFLTYQRAGTGTRPYI